MALTPEDRIEYVRYRLKKAEEAHQSALILCENRQWNAAINRLYYAAFYAVNALLTHHGIITKTHSGVKSQFLLHIVKPGLISTDHGKHYADLFDWRQKGDYGDFFDFGQEEVLAALQPTLELMQAIKLLIDQA